MSSNNRIIIIDWVPDGGSGVGFFVMLIVLAMLITQCTHTPNVDGNYKTNKKQTAYVIQNGYKILTDSHSAFEQPEYYHNSTNVSWYEDSTSTTLKVNGNFTRFTGLIHAPTCKDQTILNYWSSNPLPLGAYPGDIPLFISDSGEEQVYREMYNMISNDLRSLSNSRNVFRLSIYGDGRLLYTSPCMLYQNTPIEFNVNITGVQEIVLKYTHLYHVYGSAYGLSSIKLTDLKGHTN